MIHNGRVLGLPLTDYRETKANIESLVAEAGMTAFATDTEQWGYYDGAAWQWFDEPGDYLTEAEHTAIGDAAPHHTAVTLDADADTVLSLSTQEIGLDEQAAGTVLAGPLSGADDEPTFEQISNVLVGGGLGAHLFTPTDGLLLLGPGCPCIPGAWRTLRGQTATLVGAFNQRAGPWAGTRGLCFEKAATNLVLDPIFGNASVTAYWDAWYTTANKDTNDYLFGDGSAYIEMNDVYNARFESCKTNTGSVAQGDDITFTIYLKGSGQVNLVIAERNAAGNFLIAGHSIAYTLTSDWKRYVFKYTTTHADCSRVDVRVRRYIGTPKVYIDGAQCEKTAYYTTLIHGDQGDGYAWTGTPHASASTRTANHADLSTHVELLNNLNAVSFSIWFQVQYDAATWPRGSHYNYLFDARGSSSVNRYFLAYSETNDNFIWYSQGVCRLFTPVQDFLAGTWFHIVITEDFTNDERKLYLNGVLQDTDTSAVSASTDLITWKLGASYSDMHQSGSVYGEYAVWNRVLSAEEVAAIYASGRPLVDDGSYHNPVLDGRAVRVPVSYNNVANPPTDAELTTAFGWQPDGFTAIIDDNAGATNCYAVWRASGKWWYEELTKAV